MWKKIVDLSTDIRVKIGVSILGLVPSLRLVLKLFYVITEDHEVVAYSALEFREIYIHYGESLELFLAALTGPAITIAFVVSVVTGLAAVGLSFVRKKAAAICVYVLSSISCYTPTLAIAFLAPLFEDSTSANTSVLAIFLMFSFLILPFCMAGIALAALSKNYD